MSNYYANVIAIDSHGNRFYLEETQVSAPSALDAICQAADLVRQRAYDLTLQAGDILCITIEAYAEEAADSIDWLRVLAPDLADLSDRRRRESGEAASPTDPVTRRRS